MAISAEAATKIQQITFTAATTPPTVATSTRLNLSPGSDVIAANNSLGHQFCTVSATMTSSAAVATLVFYLADDDSATGAGAGRIQLDTATVTASNAIRQSHDSTAGDFVAQVVFTISGKNTLDLWGYGKNWPRWFVGCTVISAGSITVRITPGRAI